MNAENTEFNGAKDQETYLYEEDLVQNPSTGKWSRCKQKAVTNKLYCFLVNLIISTF